MDYVAPRPWNLVFASSTLLIVLLGCSREPTQTASSGQPAKPKVEAPIPHPATAKILGKWVVIADTSGRGDTGSLVLNRDGTFSSNYKVKGNPKETFSGTFAVSDEQVAGQNLISVKLTMLKYNGKPAPAPGPLRLTFDPVRNILHDFMSVSYARPGEEEKAKKYYERPREKG